MLRVKLFRERLEFILAPLHSYLVIWSRASYLYLNLSFFLGQMVKIIM